MKNSDLIIGLPEIAEFATSRQFTDTDPHMLFALWEMEFGVDPERSLDALSSAAVVYDKFAPGFRFANSSGDSSS